jgi:VWFA-related protein
MRAIRVAACVALFVFLPLAVVSATPDAGGAAYHVELDKEQNVVASTQEKDGKSALFVTVHFKVHHNDGDSGDTSRDRIVVEEDGKLVKELDVNQLNSQGLTTVLAMDVSGSMESHNKMLEARKAANTFLDKLDAKCDSGLITFDHVLHEQEPPGRDPAGFADHRRLLREKIQAAKPGGGTAYLDATAEAVKMLEDLPGRRAVLLMTDGVDMNSRRKMDDVIELAKARHVPVYTVGIGEPGKNEPVSTVLVLDHSGSMGEKANDRDNKTKIEALHTAAARFVELIRPGSATTLLPFSSVVEKPQPFSSNEGTLKRRIGALKPEGGTLLYDATWAGVQTLAASGRPGKHAVVVLTDGYDEAPGSRHNADDVVEAAKEAGVALHLLGLGRPGEVNEPVMRAMAKATGGSYHHAGDQQELFDVFEQLSIDLHDDGIDEEALKKLAHATGGEYYPARDVPDLSNLLEKLAGTLQETYTVTFPSRRDKGDGTARAIDVRVFRNGVCVSDVGATAYNVHGVVVPELDHRVYLVLLGGLGLLLAAPAGVRRLYKLYGGSA